MQDACLLTGEFVDTQGIPMSGASIQFQRIGRVRAMDGVTVLPGKVNTALDGEGRLSVSLVPGTYVVKLRDGKRREVWEVVVPKLEAANLHDLIEQQPPIPLPLAIDVRAQATAAGEAAARAEADRVLAEAVRAAGKAVYASRFGCGTEDDSDAWERLKAAVTPDRPRMIIDADVRLPGKNSGAWLKTGDLPPNAVIEFVANSAIVFDSDGRDGGHHYLTIDGCVGTTLINPWIRNSVTPLKRRAIPGIWVRNSIGVHVFCGRVHDTTGAGTMIQNSIDCTMSRVEALRTLADGHHITAKDGGTCLNCWTFGAYGKDCGDDLVAIVSYLTASAPLELCGHLDFVGERGIARGATLVGGRSCKLRGVVRDCLMQGVLVVRDDTFRTHANFAAHIEVTAERCGLLEGHANVEIGQGTEGLSGSATSRHGSGHGVQIADAKDVDLALKDEDAAATGIHCDGVENLHLTGLTSLRAGRAGLAILNSRRVVVDPVLITDYEQKGTGLDGIFLDNVDRFCLAGGLVDDGAPIGSERAIDVQNSSNGQIGRFQTGAGKAAIPIRRLNCEDVLLAGAD